MRIIILISLIFLTSCSNLSTRKSELTYREKIQSNIKSCVMQLLKEGFGEQLTYLICKDIYKKQVFTIPQGNHGLRQSL